MSVNADFFMVIDVLYGVRHADATMGRLPMGTTGRRLVNKDVTDLIRHPRLANGCYTCNEEYRD